MTSNKSYAKTPLLAVFCTQLRSQRMLLILFGVVLALAPMAVGFAMLNAARISSDYSQSMYMAGYLDNYASEQRQVMTLFGMVPLLGFALALAVGEFGYLNRRQKIDFYHAIPVRRSEMFIGRVLLAAASLVLGALLVILGQVLVVSIQFSTVSVDGGLMEEVYAAIWQNGAFMVLSALAVYFFAALIVIAAKNLWEAAFSFLLLSAAYPLMALLTARIVQSSMMLYRLSGDPVVSVLLSPLFTGVVALYSNLWTVLPLWVLPVLLLQAAVCGALGFWAFCRRPSERAESGASKSFRWVVRFCAAAAGAFVGSFGLLYFLDTYFAFLLGGVLGAAAAWMILELLYTHSLRGLLKTLSAGAAGLAAFAAVNVLIAFGVIGGVSLPSMDQIDAVSLHGEMGSYSGTQSAFPRSYGHLKFFDENGSHNVESASFDAETVEETYALLEEMLAHQREMYFPYHPSERAKVYDRYRVQEETSCLISVTLYMAGEQQSFSLYDAAERGRTEAIYRQAQEIVCTPQYAENNPELAQFDALKHIDGMVDGRYVQVVPTDAETEKLREAYRKDYLTVTDGTAYTGDHASSYAKENCLYFDETEEITLLGGIVDYRYPGEGRKGTLASKDFPEYKENAILVILPDDYPNTAAAIEEICRAHM